MPIRSDPLTLAARKLCRQHPDHAARGLARMLCERSAGALTIEQARSRIRYAMGLNGDRQRAKIGGRKRPNRQPGEIRAMPKSVAEPWTPHHFGATGRVGIISDLHVPYHSEIAVAAALEYLKGQDLNGILLNGDIADFYAISRWQKDPAARDFKNELSSVRDFLEYLRQEFPEIPIVYKMGNHEERWTHYLWQHAPELSDDAMMSLTAWFKLNQHGIELVEDQRIVMLGKLPVLHGHELPKGMAAPVNVARGVFLRTLSTGLVGHSHRTSGHAESDMWHHETFCWSTGCLCDMTPEYARINRWNWGFAVVDVHQDGEFDVENLRITSDGKVRSS